MKSDKILQEAKRLYAMGFAIHWLKPKSKAPVESKWTTGPRKEWSLLHKSYQKGFNVGVRLGEASKIGDKFLGVIDIDVKSLNVAHKIEAHKTVREFFPDVKETAIVKSGRGNGSCHIYVVSSEPLKPMKLKVSTDKVKVHMPSAAINQAQKELLSEEDLNEGFRMRPAWEIAVMGEGQQVVLPPSTHPDTGHDYEWAVSLESPQTLFEVNLLGKKNNEKLSRSIIEDFKAEPVDLYTSDLTNEIIELIESDAHEDRSASLLKVSIAMVKSGFTDRQILSVLTDRAFGLGLAAYDHAKTDSRKRAINWVYNYTLKKARLEFDAQHQFDEECVTETLSDEETQKQAVEILGSNDWRERIERYGGRGENAKKPKPTLKNLILIMSNEVASDVIKRDVFALRDFYNHKTPWGGVKNALISDDDAVKIRVWLSNRYRFEPSSQLVFDALTYLAEKNAYHPVKEMLEALPEWDAKNRLDTWLKDHFEAEGHPEYLAQVFRKWVVAMVMRVYRPGVKFDWMPIFEGKQGIGKSSIGRLLVGDKWFLDWLPDLSDKDSALALQGNWVVEFGELATLRKNELEANKAFITRVMDKVRPPYGRKQIEIPRQCVFFGTTNADTYLKDETGNRRFKPVKVGQLDFDAILKDREQLLAEALFIFENDLETPLSLEIDGEARIFEHEIQSQKMIEDESANMAEEIERFAEMQIKHPDSPQFDFFKFTMTDLFCRDTGPLKGWVPNGRNLVFASRALKKLEGAKRFIRGKTYWKVPRWGTLNLTPHPSMIRKNETILDN